MSENRVWKPTRPRFIVVDDDNGVVSSDRVFQNNKCVHNQNLGFSYSVDELVEVLNNNGEFQDYFNDLIQFKIWYCQAKFHDTGDEVYKIEEESLKRLRDEVYNSSSIFKYTDFLKQYHEEHYP